MGDGLDSAPKQTERASPQREQQPLQEAPLKTEASGARLATFGSDEPNPANLASRLARLDGASRMQAVTLLQKEHGNAYVQRIVDGGRPNRIGLWMPDREAAPPAGPVSEMIVQRRGEGGGGAGGSGGGGSRSGGEGAEGAGGGPPAADPLARIRVIVERGESSNELGILWQSFGSSFPQVASSNFSLWEKSVQLSPSVKDSVDLESIRARFKGDVEAFACGNLESNKKLVEEELKRYGLSEKEEVPPDPSISLPPEIPSPVPEGQRERLEELKKTAETAQKILGHIDKMKGRKFGPEQTPFNPEGAPPSDIMEKVIWEDLKRQWDSANQVLGLIANGNPALFAAINEGPQAVRLIAESDPEKSPQMALRNLRTSLLTVAENIQVALGKVRGGGVDYRDLRPVHEQLLSGAHAASGTVWSSPFYRWVAKDDIQDRQTAQLYLKLGLKAAAFVGFLVASMATFGSATFIIAAGVAVGAEAARSVSASEKASSLSPLQKSGVQSNLALVYKGQITAAEAEAEEARIGAMVNLILGVGAPAAGEAAQILWQSLKQRFGALTLRFAQEIGQDPALGQQVVKIEGLLKESQGVEQAARELGELETKLTPMAARAEAPTSIGQVRQTVESIGQSARQAPVDLNAIINRVTKQAEPVVREWVKKLQGHLFMYRDFRAQFGYKQWADLIAENKDLFTWYGFEFHGKVFLNPASFAGTSLDSMAGTLVHEVTHIMQTRHAPGLATFWQEFQAHKMEITYLRSIPVELRPSEMAWKWRMSDKELEDWILATYRDAYKPLDAKSYQEAIREAYDLMVHAIRY